MLPLLALLFCGFAAKFTDFLTERKHGMDAAIPIVIGFSYGLAGGWALVEMPLAAPAIVGIIVGVLLTLKIDHIAHAAGVLGFMVFLALAGIPEFSLGFAALLALASAVDEIGNNLADSGRLRGALGMMFRHRMFLEVSAFTLSVATLQWQVFAAVLFFDVGYFVSDRLAMMSGKAMLASQ